MFQTLETQGQVVSTTWTFFESKYAISSMLCEEGGGGESEEVFKGRVC